MNSVPCVTPSKPARYILLKADKEVMMRSPWRYALQEASRRHAPVENKKIKCKKKHDLPLRIGTVALNSEQILKIVAVSHLGQRLFCNNANKLQFHVSKLQAQLVRSYQERPMHVIVSCER